MKNLVETQPINLPFEIDDCDYCVIESINLFPVLSLSFIRYTDTKYILNADYVQELNDKIRERVLDLNTTNKNTLHSAVMKIVKKYAEFTINRTA